MVERLIYFILQLLHYIDYVRKLTYEFLEDQHYIGKDLMGRLAEKEKIFAKFSPFTLIIGFICIFLVITKILRLIWFFWSKINSFQKIKQIFIKCSLKFSGVHRNLQKIQAQTKEAMNLRFKVSKFKKIEFRPNGQDPKSILVKLEAFSRDDREAIDSRKITGSIYTTDSQIHNIASEAMSIYSYSNLLHPEQYTGARFIESQLIKLGIELFNGKDSCCGITTSGGTESILLAMMAYRNRGYKMGITSPEIIIPISAHAAFLKAAEMFCIKLVKVPLNKETYQVDISKVTKAISSNTIAIVGSFPNFPHGIFDDIEALSRIAVRYKIPLHVDACLGGFLVAFYPSANILLPRFDFNLPGVTSISVDFHKYGLSPKGISLLLYSHRDYRKHQFFFYPHFMGGIYPTPSFEGSRSPACAAGAYAVMLSLGKNKYVNQARLIHEAVIKIKKFAKENLTQIEVIGDPQICSVGFKGRKSIIVFDQMGNRGWHLNRLIDPEGFSFVITSVNMDNVDLFLKDLKEVDDLVAKNEKFEVSQNTRLYGMSVSLPEDFVKDNFEILIDSMLD